MRSRLGLPSSEEMQAMSARERAVLLHELGAIERELAVGFADLLAAERQEGSYLFDGHRSVRGWYLAHTGDDPAEAGRKIALSATLADLPRVREALFAGEITLAKTRSIVAAHRNPRVRPALVPLQDRLLADAAECDQPDFERAVREYVDLVDADGAEQAATVVHEQRNAHCSRLGDGFRGDWTCGPTQGAVIKKILDAFTDREFRADSSDRDPATGALARTPQQRRMDALYSIFTTAAAAKDGHHQEPLVNLVCDVRTAQEIVRYAATGVRPEPDLADVRSRRCETTDGVRVPRGDMLAALLTGMVRRVIVDGAGVTIDLGRRRRLFTGNARDAVMLRSTHCVWAGCEMPASWSQADHLRPYGSGGTTDANQGAPCCGHHNRFKTRGFTLHQDPNGQWHTLRTDGTSIHAPPAA